MGPEGKAQKDHWYWPHEISQARVKALQEWLPVRLLIYMFRIP